MSEPHGDSQSWCRVRGLLPCLVLATMHRHAAVPQHGAHRLGSKLQELRLGGRRIAQQQDVDVASPISAIWKPLHAAARRLEAEDLRVAEA